MAAHKAVRRGRSLILDGGRGGTGAEGTERGVEGAVGVGRVDQV